MEIMGEKMRISKEVRKTPKNEPIVNLEIKIAVSEKKNSLSEQYKKGLASTKTREYIIQTEGWKAKLL